ncbi:carbohydrate ABC transporter permease [Paenibacillus eucommiae]|uniref:Raffinose/stachyose/melibiose transport system permease protein n=1 Tax=Paenibacillus eucommiae TaxID=1355755 RepID=A0ABS4IMK6_9BACL|nr:sugar ABC transporter permease [Paenibacillus eucommiae]MBP1988809.1 raffinose/stachyose/melibiose transport system permease protein [Paenibacillus eucommiae]
MNIAKVSWRAIAIFVLPCLLLYVAIVFVPIIISLYYSFFQWNGIGAATFVGWSNYINMLTKDAIFWPSVYRTLLYAAFSMAEIPVALLLAVWLSRYVKRPNFLVSSFFLPVILSVVVIGQLWKSIYSPASMGGLLNDALAWLGLGEWARPWLADPTFAIYALIFVSLWQYLGYHLLIQFTGVQNIPQEIYEAAKIDGAEGWTVDRYITFPLVAPVFKISMVLAVIGSLKTLDIVMVMTGGGPGNATDVISSHMYKRTFSSLEYGYGSTISVFLVAACLLATLLLNKIFKRSEDAIQ